MNTRQVEKISKALGDPYRLKIMEMIKQQNDQWMQCSCVLQNIGLAQSTISHHINQLVDADLLLTEKDGRNMLYKINKDVMNEYVNFLNVFSV